MIRAGQQSTFSKLLFIENRMKIETLIEEGLLLGEFGKADAEGMVAGDRRSMHLRGQAMRSSAEPNVVERSNEEVKEKHIGVIQELNRHGSVFHDDSELEGEDSDTSEDETALVLDHGHDTKE